MGVFFSNSQWINDLELLFQDRTEKSQDAFIEECIKCGFERKVCELLVNEIYKYLPKLDRISLEMDDDLHNDLQFDEEDLGDILTDIISSLKLKLPSRKSRNIYFKDTKRLTIMEALKFITWVQDSQ